MSVGDENGLRMLDDQEVELVAGAWFGSGVFKAIGHAAQAVGHVVHDASGVVSTLTGAAAGIAALVPGGKPWAIGFGAVSAGAGYLHTL